MSRPVTIKDLAKALNISVSTVSRALRNARDINPETQATVLNLAKELHYEPNFIAQSLIRKRTNIIGVIVPSINSNYFSEALSGMSDLSIEQQYHLMICQSNEIVSRENKCILKLLACNIDGLLISVSKDTTSADAIINVQHKDIPVVMFDRVLQDVDCTKVIVDEYEGAYKAVEHLLRKGCKRIGHLGGPKDLSVSQKRKQGYLDAMKNHKLPVYPKLVVHCKSFEEDARPAIKKILHQKPDGLFCINDLSAIIALQYARKKGIEVPEELKIVGFNNDPVSKVSEPGLTTVMQPGYEVGKLAMGVLIDEVERKLLKHKQFVLRTRLIIRKSSR